MNVIKFLNKNIFTMQIDAISIIIPLYVLLTQVNEII